MKLNVHRRAQLITTAAITTASVGVVLVEHFAPNAGALAHGLPLLASMVWIWIE